MANSYLGARSPKGDVGVRGVVDSGELSAYSAGVLSGFDGNGVASWTIDIGGISGTQDVLVAKNPNGESELLVSTAGQSLAFIIGGAPGTPGQSRTDALVAYKDPFTTSTVNDSIDTVDYAVVAGTAATTGTQVPPDDTAIRTAISGTLYFVGVIGYVTIAYGASSVSLGNYTVNLSQLNSLLEETPISATAKVTTSQTTASTSFVDLTTAGPAVTVTVPDSGKVLLSFGCQIANSVSGNVSLVAVGMSGANSATPALDNIYTCWYQASGNNFGNVSKSFVVDGLTPGSTTFTLKYAVGAGTGTFRQRYISVMQVL